MDPAVVGVPFPAGSVLFLDRHVTACRRADKHRDASSQLLGFISLRMAFGAVSRSALPAAFAPRVGRFLTAIGLCVCCCLSLQVQKGTKLKGQDMHAEFATPGVLLSLPALCPGVTSTVAPHHVSARLFLSCNTAGVS